MSAPPIRQLEHWTLVSSNIERTKRFYTEVMGAKEPEDHDGPVSVILAGTIIHILPKSANWAVQPGDGGHHYAYAIDVEDYDHWVAHLRAHDVPTRMTSHGFGRMSIYLDDPDGYHIEMTVVFTDTETGRREIEKRGVPVSWLLMNRPSS